MWGLLKRSCDFKGITDKRWDLLILLLMPVAWHLVPLLVMHRAPAGIAWWCLYAVASRILIVWLFNNEGAACLRWHRFTPR